MPKSRKGAAHWPTKRLLCFLPKHCTASDNPMAPKDAHKKVSEGNFDVWFSMAFATFPSSRCWFGMSSIKLNLNKWVNTAYFFFYCYSKIMPATSANAAAIGTSLLFTTRGNSNCCNGEKSRQTQLRQVCHLRSFMAFFLIPFLKLRWWKHILF